MRGAGEWDEALAAYQAARAFYDTLTPEDAGVDEAVDTYCTLMDHLIESVPAPHVTAVSLKLKLALERSSGFEGMQEGHEAAIVADLDRLASLGDRVAADSEMWEHRLQEYRRLNALVGADAAFGAYHRAMEDFARTKYEIEIQYGSLERARQTAEGEQARKAWWSRYTEAEAARSEVIERASLAAIALTLTPSPDLDAAIFKIEVIKEYELDNDTRMERDPMAIVAEDMERLRKAELLQSDPSS